MEIYRLTELHCHVLPGIDDGARDVQMSLAMLDALGRQGVQTVVCTPHYYSDSISLSDFLQKRTVAFEQLCAQCPAQAPKLYAAAEVYISDYLFSNENLDALKIADGNYMLIEHSFSESFSDRTLERLENLCCNYNVRPLLAHIERYESLLRNPDLLQELMQIGCATQVNVASFADLPRGWRKKLFKLFEHGLVHVIGSDCHNMTSRPPEYRDGLKAIEKAFGVQGVQYLLKNAQHVLNGEPMVLF